MRIEEKAGVLSDINITPLVDVMLVLLIIFMISAPLMTHTVKVRLPSTQKVMSDRTKYSPPLDLAIKANGSLYLNDRPVSHAALKARLGIYAHMSPQPELQVRADHATKWKVVRTMLSEARHVGMIRVGFVTTSDARS